RVARPAAARDRATPGPHTGLEAGRLGDRARRRRNGDRAADPLPDAPALRRCARLARHLPDTRFSARLRRRDPRRGLAAGAARPAGTDPRRRRGGGGGVAAAPPACHCRILDMRMRRAAPADADFLVDLLTHEEVEPYLSAISAKDREGIVAAIERSEQEPDAF